MFLGSSSIPFSSTMLKWKACWVVKYALSASWYWQSCSKSSARFSSVSALLNWFAWTVAHCAIEMTGQKQKRGRSTRCSTVLNIIRASSWRSFEKTTTSRFNKSRNEFPKKLFPNISNLRWREFVKTARSSATGSKAATHRRPRTFGICARSDRIICAPCGISTVIR